MGRCVSGRSNRPRCSEMKKHGACEELLEGQSGTKNSRRRVERGEAGEGHREGLVSSGVLTLSKSNGE